MHYIRICAESPEDATKPAVRFYPDIDDKEVDEARDNFSSNTTTPSGSKGKGKARQFEDTLLSNLDMTPSKKSHKHTVK